MDPLFYSKTVTYDTSEKAGAAPGCTDTLRAAFKVLTDVAGLADADAGTNMGSQHSLLGRRATGHQLQHHHKGDKHVRAVSDALRVCPTRQLNTSADVAFMRDWAASAFDMMAMGNYPCAAAIVLVHFCILLAQTVEV